MLNLFCALPTGLPGQCKPASAIPQCLRCRHADAARVCGVQQNRGGDLCRAGSRWPAVPERGGPHLCSQRAEPAYQGVRHLLLHRCAKGSFTLVPAPLDVLVMMLGTEMCMVFIACPRIIRLLSSFWCSCIVFAFLGCT